MLEFIYSHISLQTLIWLIVVFPLLGALINGLLTVISSHSEIAKFKNWISLIACSAAILSFLSAVVIFHTLTGFDVGAPAAITGPLIRWTASSSLVIDVGLKVDQLSLVVALVFSGIGAFVHIYSVGYMWRDNGFGRYFSLLNLYLFFVLLLVLADNLVLAFVGWEGIGVFSYLLIGYWFDDTRKTKAATKAFIVDRIGSACLLAGIFLIFGVVAAGEALPESGAFSFETMGRYAAYFVPVATPVSLLVLAAAVARSAQLPLYVWLPGAVAAPAPASALVHASTMVAAGIYIIVRLNFIFALSPVALHAMAIIGAVTIIYAATIAIVEHSLKRILIFSTMSQVGYMFLAAGMGAFGSAIFYLLVHSTFNALLFLAAGSAIYAMGGEDDIRDMGALKDRMPVTAWTFVIAAVALAGIFPTSGFFGKNAVLWQAYERGHTVIWLCGFVGVGLSAFYIFRAAGSVFFGRTAIHVNRFKRIAESPISMVIPMMLLATAAVFGGFIGVPEALGGMDRFAVWIGELIPIELSRIPGEESDTLQIVLMIITVIWSIHFSIIGWLIYAQKRDWADKFALRLAPFYKLVLNNFYVDKIYDLLIVKPIVWFSRVVLWQTIDKTIVDGIAVEGSARSVGFFAMLAQAAQTGVLQQYLLYFLIGAVIVVGYLAL